jgi:hypothetical protein
MSAGTLPAAEAVAGLRAALQQTAAALAAPNLDALLAAEQQIEAALARLPPVEALSSEERMAVRAEVEAASGALTRCRRLGAALNEFVRTSLDVQGRGAEYGPRQHAAGHGVHALDARV